jgi:ribosome-binding factor A
MSYRLQRVAHIIRDVVSDAIANRVSDPRVHRFTSVTRVEVSTDLRFADVHVSVMGTETESQTTMKGLQSARGMIQTRLAKRLEIRQCPLLRFHLDKGIKIGIETIRTLDEVLAESKPSDGERWSESPQAQSEKDRPADVDNEQGEGLEAQDAETGNTEDRAPETGAQS